MPEYKELIAHNQELKKQLDERQTLEIQSVLEFIKQARTAGSHINDPNQREELRIVLREWGAFVYDKTKEFPATQLMPYTEQAEKSSLNLETKRRLQYNQNKWLPISGIVLVFLAGLFGGIWAFNNGYFVRSDPTPTRPPLLPPPSFSTISCPFSPLEHTLLTGLKVPVDARILTPQHCADGFEPGNSIPISGIYSGELDNLELWILIYTRQKSDGVYYPQACEEPHMLSKNGEWGTIMRLGGNTPQLFDVILVAVEINGEASQSIRSKCSGEDDPYMTAKELRNNEGMIAKLDIITIQSR